MGERLFTFGIELVGAVGSFGIDLLQAFGHLLIGGGGL
jgi:hypothetical protein